MKVKRSKFSFALLLLSGLVLVTNCAKTIPVTQFQDIKKQKLNKSRVVFEYDVDLSTILEAENVVPKQIISVKSHGKTYITGKGLSNLYIIEPSSGTKAKFKPVKLVRNAILPFKSVKLDWAENEQISFIWEDEEGTHTNVIDKKSKAKDSY